MFKPDDNALVKRQKALQQLRKDRRNKMIKSDVEENLNNWNLHEDGLSIKIPDYLVPEKLSIDNYNTPLVFPYRSARKMKSLEHTIPEINLLNAKSYKQLNSMIPHYNNFNIHDSFKKYSLKTYSPYRYTYIGDLFFESNKAVFLLLINVNTRYLYAYQIGKVESNEILDKHQKFYNKYSIAYLPGNWKSTDTLIKVFKYHLKDHKMNILRFDNEPAIQSKQFQQFLKDNNIYFQLTIANMHTSLALIDRVCRTIRDISFNLNLKGGIYNQQAMDLILYYYNNTAHDTLTQMIFKLYPELKKIYPEGITPAIMEDNPDLENLYVKACINHNFEVKKQSDFILNPGDIVKISFNGDKFTKKRAYLDKSDYVVQGYIGNMLELKNLKNGNIEYRPRYQVKFIQRNPNRLLKVINAN